MSEGYVYILINPSMPGLIKIGRTTRDGRTRARELQSTGVPTPFEVAFELFAPDHEQLETRILQELDEFRVAGNREFFRFPLRKAIACLNAFARQTTGISSPHDAESIFSRLQARYAAWIRQDITDVRMMQTHDRVWLEITEEVKMGGYMRDQIIRRTDLAFCCEEDGADLCFKPDDAVSANAERFLREWCPYSLVMTTDLFHAAACEYIVHQKKYNPHIATKNDGKTCRS